MKRSKKMILLLCALALMIGGYYGVQGLNRKESVSESSGTFDLTTRTMDDLTGISWTVDGITRRFIMKDGTWETADSPAWPVNQEVLQELAEGLVNLQATRKIENVSSIEDYGLVQPVITVTAEWKSGTTVYSMGDATPFEDGYYLSLSGQDNMVYTIAASLETTFSKSQTDLAALEGIPAVAEATGLTVGTALNAVRENESSTVDPDQLWYDAETGAALDGTEIESLISTARGISWKSLVSAGASEEELEKWGLDDSQATAVTLTGSDGAASAVLFGATNDDGDYYARLSGSSMVYTVESGDIHSLITASSDSLKVSSLLPVPYDALAYAEFETGKGSFRLENTAEEANAAEDGTEAGDSSAEDEKKKLWEQAAALKAAGTPEKAVSGDQVLRIHAVSVSGRETEVTIAEYNAENYLASVDGGAPVLVAADETDALVRAVRAMQ